MLHHEIFRKPGSGGPLVLAAFSYRYDAHLVPDLLENIREAVHGYVAWDDRAATGVLSSEPARRKRLIDAARHLGADWLLTPDPDERFERGFAGWLPDLLDQGTHTLWRFRLFEMFAPSAYRVDGLWGAKSVLRLFPLAAAEIDPARALHGRWVRADPAFVPRDAQVNLYHLRMASPVRRRLRRDLYAAADPDRRHQSIGYDYLADDRGMVLNALPEGRDFLPPFVEDHQTWAPDPGPIGAVTADPLAARLRRVARSVERRGAISARHVLADLSRDAPDDPDLPLLAAMTSLLADEPLAALTSTQGLPGSDPAASYLRSLAHICRGDPSAALAPIARLQQLVPSSPIVAALAAEACRATTSMSADTAPWRVLCPDAVLHEGAEITRSDLAVIVLGYRNQPGLLEAVRSVLDQDVPAEVVVVNSGGGDVLASLAPVLDRVRILSVAEPLFVGAARDIGVAASRAPYVAFLAGDCLARPGWNRTRLSLHREGALTVSSAVVAEPDAPLVALAASRLRYAVRHPDADPRVQSDYGLSYARRLLWLVGVFPPGLRVAEDTALNQRAATLCRPVWAPDVQTVHRDVRTMADFVRDEGERGERRASHPSLRRLAMRPDIARATAHLFRQRRDAARALQTADPSLTSATRRAMAAMQWVATMADRAGTLRGLQRIAEAERLSSRAIQESDLALSEHAWQLDPQDPAKAFLSGCLRLDSGDETGAEAAFRAALALDPMHEGAAQMLVGLVADRDGSTEAWHLAERLALAAPLSKAIWALAAEAAVDAGHPAWALVLGVRALAAGVDWAPAHAGLARLHAILGTPAGERHRSVCAKCLETPSRLATNRD